jgi:hypothetical protein
MAIEKVIDITIQGNADERVGSLRSQLREAQADVAALSEKFGVTSKEAIEAAKRAGQLKDQIGDAKALTDAFNPDAKFKALSSSLAGVAGGFAALQGAQALFGSQSKEVEQTLLKVQSAMAISQGLQTIGESVDSFKQLSAVAKSYTIVQKIVTAGQWLWNAALAANPIGALVVVIAALIAAGVALVNYFKESSAETAKNTAAVNANKKALDNQTKSLEKNASEFDRKQKQELAMAKASGMSAEAIRVLELKLIDEKIAYEKSARAIAFNTYEKNKNYLASLKASGADEELIKKQIELTNESVKQVNKQNENLKKAFDEKKDIQNRHQVEIRQSQTDHNKKSREDNYKNQKEDLEEKLANDKLSFNQRRELVNKIGFLEAQDRKDLLKKINEDEKKLKEDQANEKLKNEQEFAKTLRDKQVEEAYKSQDEIEAARKANEEDLMSKRDIALKQEEEDYKIKKKRAENSANDIEELKKQHERNVKQITDDARLLEDEKTAAKLEKTISDESLSFENRLAAVDAEQAIFQKQLDDKLITEEQFNDKTKTLSAARVNIDKAEAAAKQALFAKTSEILNKGADLLGKNTAAGKAMAAAAALINTYKGITAELATTTATPFEIGLKIANVAIIAATGFKAVKDILSVQVPGSNGGGGGGAQVGSAPSMTAPSFNTVGSSSTNQLAQTIGQQSQTPIKTYVTASDVTTGQALDRSIISNASIG